MAYNYPASSAGSGVAQTLVKATGAIGAASGGAFTGYTETLDLLSEFNPTTGAFVASRTGLYLYNVFVWNNGGSNFGVSYKKNGGAAILIVDEGAGTVNASCGGSYGIDLVAGDSVVLHDDGTGSSANTLNLNIIYLG